MTSETKLNIPSLRIEPSRGWVALNLSELWAYRELLYFLTWRDVKVKYKQTIIGAGWAIVQPLTTMVVFTLVFKKIADISSEGIPYPIFAYTALLPWNLFATALNRSTVSLVSQVGLISKVYFPRLIIPLSAAILRHYRFRDSFRYFGGHDVLVWHHAEMGYPVAAFVHNYSTGCSPVGGVWLAALNVRYRDVGHTIPFLIQIWMFASPVAYPVGLIPEKWRLLYSFNPLAGVIEGFRWALLGKESPDFRVIAVSTMVVFALLFGGLIYFKRTERTFADLV